MSKRNTKISQLVIDHKGRVGEVWAIDRSPITGRNAAYLLFNGGKSADWVDLRKLSPVNESAATAEAVTA